MSKGCEELINTTVIHCCREHLPMVWAGAGHDFGTEDVKGAVRDFCRPRRIRHIFQTFDMDMTSFYFENPK